MKSLTGIEAVVFDFDGVLVESAMLEELKLYDFENDASVARLKMRNASDMEIFKCMSDIMFKTSRNNYMVFIWLGIFLPILASRVKLAICSNNCRKNIFYTLGGLMKHFSCVKTWESVGFENIKPHPQGLKDIMRELNISDSSKILLIGDTMVDVFAAKNAGTQIALAFWGKHYDVMYDKKNKMHLLDPESLLRLIPEKK